MADTWTIVTAADAAYFTLLRGLLASIWDATAATLSRRPDIHVLDLGFTPDQRQWLEPRVTGLIAEVDDGLVIVGGDLNATPDMPATARLAKVINEAAG